MATKVTGYVWNDGEDDDEEVEFDAIECPFKHKNGSRQTDLTVEHDDEDDDVWWVDCDVCRCRGPIGGTAEEAVKLWNNLNLNAFVDKL